VRRGRLATVGRRAFPVSAINLWNSLPAQLTSAPSLTVFRQRLKTSLPALSPRPDIPSLHSAVHLAVTVLFLATLRIPMMTMMVDELGSIAQRSLAVWTVDNVERTPATAIISDEHGLRPLDSDCACGCQLRQPVGHILAAANHSCFASTRPIKWDVIADPGRVVRLSYRLLAGSHAHDDTFDRSRSVPGGICNLKSSRSQRKTERYYS